MIQFNEHSANFSNSCAGTVVDYVNNYKVGISSAVTASVEVAKFHETCDAPAVINDDEPKSYQGTERSSAIGRLSDWLSDTNFIDNICHFQPAADTNNLQLPPRSRSDSGPSRNQAGFDQSSLLNENVCDHTKSMIELSEWLSLTQFEEEENTGESSHPPKRRAPSRNNSCPVEEPCPRLKRAKYLHRTHEQEEVDARSSFRGSSSIENSVNPTNSGLYGLPKRGSFRRVTLSNEEPKMPNQAATQYSSCIPTNNKGSILEESDRAVCTRYFYEVMSQMQPCSFRESDALVGKRPTNSNGYPGLECRHCKGKCMNHGRFFPTQVKTFMDRTKSIDTFHNHLVKCVACPDVVKENLTQLKHSHTREIAELRAKGVTKSQKVFLDRIWTRLHSSV